MKSFLFGPPEGSLYDFSVYNPKFLSKKVTFLQFFCNFCYLCSSLVTLLFQTPFLQKYPTLTLEERKLGLER